MTIQDIQLQQGTRVSFFISGSIKGSGKIVGIASNALPIIGRNYIIEPDDRIDNDTYPYSHFVCPEIFIERLIKNN